MVVGFLPGLALIAVIYILTRVFHSITAEIKNSSLFILISLFIFIHINDLINSSLILSGIASALLAIGIVRIYRTSVFLPTFMSFAAFLVVITPLVFSFSADVRQILLPQQTTASRLTGNTIDKKPVVLLLFDELPLLSLLDSNGNINFERFPNFGSFSTQSTWYKYATTVAEATTNAVPPILTGKFTGPSNQKLPLAANYPDSIFTLLAASHEINAFETFTQICPEDLCKGNRPDWRMIAEDTLVVLAHTTAPDNLKQKLPQIDNKWVGYLRDAEELKNLHTDTGLHPHKRYKVRLDKFNQFMFELETIQAASLNYLHILMPHSPWMYLPDGRIYSQAEIRSFTGTLPPGSPRAKQTSQLYSQAHIVEYAQQRHLLQTGYLDSLLGDVLSLLRKRNLFDDALIIVMADHGASFMPGESLRRANEASYQDVLSIPLFIKYPGQKQAETSFRAARSIDVLPTIVDVLNGELKNFEFDGRSLRRDNDTEQVTLGLQRDTGEILKFQFAAFKERFQTAIKARKSALTNGGFDQIYTLNDEGLLNRKVRQLPTGEPVDYTLQLDNPQLYQDMDIEQNSIPALIRANRSTQSESVKKVSVAVAVNGVVRGVSVLQHIETVESDFQVLVAPESFQNGVNTIDFYQLNKVSGTTSLSPIYFESESNVELIIETNDSLTLNFNSQKLPVVGTGAYGEMIIVSDAKTNKIRLTGWAANSQNGHIATNVFIFSGHKLIASIRPRSRFPQAQEFTGFAGTEYSGFNLIIPVKEQTKSGPESLTAIAVFESDTNPLAGELRYLNNAKQLIKTRVVKLNRDILAQTLDKGIVQPGRVYDFSDDTEAQLFSGSGWSNASSNDGRWNVANEASLSFTAKNDEYPLELIVQASPFFVAGKYETQVIEAQLLSEDRQLIRLQRGETDGKFSIHIAPQDIGTDGAVVIKLKFLNAASPKSLNVNSDTRLLAIRVKTLQVLIANSDAN